MLHKFTKKAFLQHPQVSWDQNTPETTIALLISYFINFKYFMSLYILMLIIFHILTNYYCIQDLVFYGIDIYIYTLS